MSDDRVRTHVLTDDGAITFHDYFTQLGCEPAVRGFQYAGADFARIPDEVLDALHAADLEAVVIGPANPYHAIRCGHADRGRSRAQGLGSEDDA